MQVQAGYQRAVRADQRAVTAGQKISGDYLKTLESLPARMRARYLEGRFADANPNALFPDEHIDRWRVIDGVIPDMVRKQKVAIAISAPVLPAETAACAAPSLT